MRNRIEHIRRAAVLILAAAGLITCTAPFSASSGLASAQAAAPSWSYTGSLNTLRSGYTTTLLANGEVLVVGGFTRDASNQSLIANSAELYDPAAGTWRLTGGPNLPRSYHTATLLLNGKVLVVGGSTLDASNQYVGTNSAELYDPATGAWSFTGSFNTNPGSAILLQNGKVLVVGGAIAPLRSYTIQSQEHGALPACLMRRTEVTPQRCSKTVRC